MEGNIMEKDLEQIRASVAAHREEILNANDRIHRFAEMAYQEFQSSALLIGILEENGFQVEKGLADMPTCFLGRWGNGAPVMGILGEYDALECLSQEAGNPEHRPVQEGAPGHGCGHCALGTASLSAAIAVKEYLEKNQKSGTVIYFGCPAEEGAGAKQFMARAGLFDDCDFVYTWHPATVNQVSADSNSAIMGATFTFDGITAHAGACPWNGRSALDACELMNVGCNYLREHMEDGQRVHYAYSNAGGSQPNVVPAHASVKYEVRARRVSEVKELFARVVDVAKGAALMTGTKLSYEVSMAFSDFESNRTLAPVMSDCLKEVGAPSWDDEDYALAEKYLHSYDPVTLGHIRQSMAEMFGEESVPEIEKRPLHAGIFAFDPRSGKPQGGSTDVGDVSYAVPTVELNIATACIGNIGHTWQMAGQAGSRIAQKGLLTAAEIMALACVRTMDRRDLIEKAKEEVRRKNGGHYQCPLPDSAKPPIGTY